MQPSYPMPPVRRGYSFNKRTHKFVARISIGDKMKHLGTFSSPFDAQKAYSDEFFRVYGFFPNLLPPSPLHISYVD